MYAFKKAIRWFKSGKQKGLNYSALFGFTALYFPVLLPAGYLSIFLSGNLFG